MLYKIKDKYYILVGSKYIKVDVIPNGKDDIKLKPNMEDYIERNKNVKTTTVNVDDNFKKQFIRNSKSIIDNSRYDR